MEDFSPVILNFMLHCYLPKNLYLLIQNHYEFQAHQLNRISKFSDESLSKSTVNLVQSVRLEHTIVQSSTKISLRYEMSCFLWCTKNINVCDLWRTGNKYCEMILVSTKMTKSFFKFLRNPTSHQINQMDHKYLIEKYNTKNSVLLL